MRMAASKQIAQLSFDEELFEAEIKPSYWVNQSTSLINMAQNLTITERRIIYSLIALVQPDDKDFKTYVIGVKDLAELIGYKGKSFYNQVEKAIDGIMGKQLTVYSNDGKQDIVEKIQWVQQAKYEYGTGRVTIKLSDGLARYLLNLESYAKYRLINVLKLNSEYSWRIYELLKEDQWKTKEVIQGKRKWKSYRILRVVELRRLLNIPDNTLTRMTNFKATVLDQAKKELNEKTDLEFDYEVHKKAGRNIDSFIFYIDDNKKNKPMKLDIDSAKEDMQALIYLLVRHGVRQDTAIKMANDYNFDYLDANLRYVLGLDLYSINNKAGYLISAIEENYAAYEGSAKKVEEDPISNLIISQVGERLQNISDRDNKSLESILKFFERRLQDNPETNIKVIIEKRKEAVFNQLEEIENLRKTAKHPPLLKDDLKHPTIRDLFQEWKKSEIEVF